MMTRLISLHRVAADLAALGITIRPDFDEYRVNFRHATADLAEVAHTLPEALEIGRSMAGGSRPLCRACRSGRMAVWSAIGALPDKRNHTADAIGQLRREYAASGGFSNLFNSHKGN